MFLNNNAPYSDSLRNHVLIAALLGLFIAFVIIFLKPFGAGQQQGTFEYQNLYFSGYGLLVGIAYLFCYLLFDFYYRRVKQWKWAEEIIFILFFISFTIFIAHFYTELMINKNPSRITLKIFLSWFRVMFFSFGIIIAILTVLLRKQFAINSSDQSNEKLPPNNNPKEMVVLRSDLKKEVFKVDSDEIVYLKSEDNYVTIYYFTDNDLHQKMMRISLTKIHKQLPKLLKVHRSYLVNPDYIFKMQGNSQTAKLQLKQIEQGIPVSKTYYLQVKERIH